MRAFFAVAISDIQMNEFSDYCGLAERILSKVSIKIDRFSINFPTTKDRVSYLYSPSNIKKGNCKSLDNFVGVSFTGSFLGKAKLFDSMLNFTKSEVVLTVEEVDNYSKFIDIARYVCGELMNYAEVNFAFADCMEKEKWVEFFAKGISYSGRTKIENDVACNISRGLLVNKKPSFLFAYNLFADSNNLACIEKYVEAERNTFHGFVEILLPSCFVLEIDDYCTYSMWNEIYETLKKENVIVNNLKI